MARTEPATEISGLTDGHASQVRADSEHDQPLGVLDTVRVGLRVPQRLDLYFVGFLDLVGCAVADEDWLAAPFDDNLGTVSGWRGDWVGGLDKTDVLALWDAAEVDFYFCHGQDIGRGGHVDEEVYDVD